jgi:HEAT repeat protein
MMPLFHPRPLVLTALLLGCTILALYVGLLLHISIVYTHLFYIPIVLAGLWYPRTALLPALYLGILHLGVEYAGVGALDVSVIARAGSFLLVAGLVGLIAGRSRRGERASLQYMSSYAERVSTPRARIQSTFDGVRMSLGMNMDVEKMREQRNTAGLIRTLDHPNPEVRYQAVDALGTLHDPVAVERLARALRDPDCGVRWKAAEALGKLRGTALPHLFEALQDPAPDVRWRAALALGDTEDEEAIGPLIGALADPDPYVQGRAVVALSRFGGAAIAPLTRTLKEKEDAHTRNGVIRALGRLGDPGLASIEQMLQEYTKEETFFPALSEAFLDLGSRSVPVLIHHLLVAEDPTLRAFACRILGDLGDTDAVKPLIHIQYTDTSEQVRHDADAAVRRLKAIAKRAAK